MVQAFIDLGRKFFPADADSEGDPERIRDTFITFREGISWLEMLEKWRVVILASAGSGKTEEFKAAKERLYREGKRSFFCSVGMLVSLNVTDCLDPRDKENFESWLNSDDEAWFFLDSVDEAKVDSHKAFEVALRRFSGQIGAAKDRAHILISSRVGPSWKAVSDKALVSSILLMSPQKTQVSERIDAEFEIDSNSHVNSLAANDSTDESNQDSNCALQVYQISPLNGQQISEFVAFKGISNSQDFLDAVERKNLISLANRPQDLLDLIAYWLEKGVLKSYQEMIAFNISKKLEEINPSHRDSSSLSVEKAHKGAECLAATVTLAKKPYIILPDRQAEIRLKPLSIEPSEVLSQWSSPEIEELLNRAVFDEELYGTAHFHHRSVREYLTALWLRHLIEEGAPRRSIKGLIFTQQYGCNVVIPSMRPIAAWLALWDEKIQNRLCQDFPEVLLTSGDPSSLSVDIRKRLLKNFSKQYEKRKRSGVYIEPAMVRLLVSPELSDTVAELLSTYASQDEICSFLLRLVIAGGLSEASETLLSLVVGPELDITTRTDAVEAITSVGSVTQHQALIDWLLSNEETPIDSKLVSELFPSLYPEPITVAVLLEILRKVEPPSRFSMPILKMRLKDLINSEVDLDRAKELLTGLSALLETEPYVGNRSYRLSKQFEWLQPYAIQCANKWIDIKDSFALESLILGLIHRWVSNHRHHTRADAELEKLLDGARQWPEFCYELFWYAVDTLRSNESKFNAQPKHWCNVSPTIGNFWTPTADSKEALLNKLATAEALDDRYIALSGLWTIYNDLGRENALMEKIKAAICNEPSLQTQLSNFINPPPPSAKYQELIDTELQWQAEENEFEDKKSANQREWRDALPTMLDEIRSADGATEGKVKNSVLYLYEYLDRSSETNWHIGKSEWRRLIPEFGLSVAEAFKDGCMQYWRNHDPFSMKDWATINSIPYARVIGLIGLAIESHEKSDWVEALTDLEAVPAAHYSILEINGFAPWFPELQQVFPKQVDEVIYSSLTQELDESEEDYRIDVLHKIHQSSKNLQLHYQPFIIQLLTENKVEHINRLENALDISFVETGVDRSRRELLTKMLLFQIEDASIVLNKARLVAALTHIDADEGLSILTNWISSVSNIGDKVTAVEHFSANLTTRWHHGVSRYSISSPDYQRVDFLAKLIPFIYKYIRPEDDIYHSGVYSPGLRDAAQENRAWLVSLVADTPGKESYSALTTFSELVGDSPNRDYLLKMAKDRAAQDAELPSWSEANVSEFMKDAEKQPASEKDLFDLACFRLDDLKLEFEDGDTSEASIFMKTDDEVEIRNAFANRLGNQSHSRYRIAQEEEFPDKKRTDIRFSHPAIAQAIPVELKIAHKWSYTELVERLENQLIGQYMRESSYGIFLLAHNGGKQYWKPSGTGQKLSFFDLTKQLNEVADQLLEKYPHILGIRVVGIDFTIRANI